MTDRFEHSLAKLSRPLKKRCGCDACCDASAGAFAVHTESSSLVHSLSIPQPPAEISEGPATMHEQDHHLSANSGMSQSETPSPSNAVDSVPLDASKLKLERPAPTKIPTDLPMPTAPKTELPPNKAQGNPFLDEARAKPTSYPPVHVAQRASSLPSRKTSTVQVKGAYKTSIREAESFPVEVATEQSSRKRVENTLRNANAPSDGVVHASANVSSRKSLR
jgi:hypothetical protein